MKSRTRYYLICIGWPIVASMIAWVLLRPEFYGADLTDFIRIGAPIFYGAVLSWYLLTHIPKDAIK